MSFPLDGIVDIVINKLESNTTEVLVYCCIAALSGAMGDGVLREDERKFIVLLMDECFKDSDPVFTTI